MKKWNIVLFSFVVLVISTLMFQFYSPKFSNNLESVVHIMVIGHDNEGDTNVGVGTGFILNENGYIVTNNHVISGANLIKVSFPDGSRTDGFLIQTDPDMDVALIRVFTSKKLKPVKWADSDDVSQGDIVYAIGSPLGNEFSISSGIISHTKRFGLLKKTSLIQSDVAINQGNSGGPLFNEYGKLIGVNVAIISKSGGSHGISLSIPSNTAKRTIEKFLIKGKKPEYPTLGLIGEDYIVERAGLEKEEGFTIKKVIAKSPAEKMGLKEGHIVVSINGIDVNNNDELLIELAKNSIGDQVKIGYLDGTKLLTTSGVLFSWKTD